jgi:hypothetical protein
VSLLKVLQLVIHTLPFPDQFVDQKFLLLGNVICRVGEGGVEMVLIICISKHLIEKNGRSAVNSCFAHIC